MKKHILLLINIYLLIFSCATLARGNYNLETRTLFLPVVSINGENFEALLNFDDKNSQFLLSSFQPSSLRSDQPAIFDSTTNKVSIPYAEVEGLHTAYSLSLSLLATEPEVILELTTLEPISVLPPYLANSPCSTLTPSRYNLETSELFLPLVNVGNTNIQAKLSSDNNQFLLSNSQPSFLKTNRPATYLSATGTVSIPCIEVIGSETDTVYSATLTLIATEPEITLELTSVAEVDAEHPPSTHKLVSDTDLSVSTRGLPVTINRTYLLDSKFNGPMGYGWTHSYRMRVVEAEVLVNAVPGNAIPGRSSLTDSTEEQPGYIIDGTVQIFNADGTGSYFTPKSDGTYQTPKGDYRILTKQTNGQYRLRNKLGTEFSFAANGKLFRIKDRNGNKPHLL